MKNAALARQNTADARDMFDVASVDGAISFAPKQRYEHGCLNRAATAEVTAAYQHSVSLTGQDTEAKPAPKVAAPKQVFGLQNGPAGPQ